MPTSPSYFGDRTWSTISREERYYCAELYFTLSRMPSLTPFIGWLKSQCSELKHLGDDGWTVGYEVCFYRDMIHAFGVDGTFGIRGMKNAETGEDYMPKRTFDLALFHPDHILIVGAKVQQGLDRKQLASFARDERDVKALLNTMNRHVPKVHTVLLAKERYVTSSKGLAHAPPFKAAISWKQIAEQGRSWGADKRSLEAFARAEQVV